MANFEEFLLAINGKNEKSLTLYKNKIAIKELVGGIVNMTQYCEE